MLLTFLTAFPILADIIRNRKRHSDYNRVNELAEYYHKLITGEDAESLLVPFVRREDAVMFQQRVALTQLVTEAWADTLMNPFYRIGRLDNIKKLIAFDTDVPNADVRVAEIEDRLSTFYGPEPLEKFLATRFVELSFTDPNAFLAVEFDAFNNVTEKARPYPVEYSSKEAIDFKYINNILQYLVIKKDIVVDGKPAEKYLMYLPNEIIQLTQVFNIAGNQVIGNNEQERIIDGYWQCSPDRVFLVEYFQPKAGEVQAKRIGYKSDLRTKGRTFVNPFHATLPFFRKSIKIVSEADLSAALHAFPQKLQYEEVCDGFPDEGITCHRGKDVNGNLCKACNGEGVKVHTSAQDMITRPMPREGAPAPAVSLEDTVVYKSPPTDILVWQDEKIDKLKAEAISTMYNSEVLQKTTIQDTATGQSLKRDEIYNTLHPAAENHSSVWKFFARVTSALLDHPKPKLLFEFPSDYKIQTVSEMLDELKKANESGGPASLKQSLALDITAKVYVDDEYAFLKEKSKSKWIPMLGRSEETVLLLISLGKLTDEEEILWIHSDSIFDELENEVSDFFYFTYDKQWEYIRKKVEEIAKKIKAKSTISINAYATNSQTVTTD
jgi:hypothetical protein